MPSQEKLTKLEPVMLFSESRYDFQGACGPIFGIKSMLPPAQRFGCQSSQISDHSVALGADYPHIGFQKKT
jgi:hypothetical protein